jgi:serine phosphatase RsbU (regulator of sigma subunit)
MPGSCVSGIELPCSPLHFRRCVVTASATLRVLLVERAPARTLVEQTLADLREAAAVNSSLHPHDDPPAHAVIDADVVLLSVSQYDDDGRELVRRARRADPHVPVIVLSRMRCRPTLSLRDQDDDLLLHTVVDRVQLARSILFALERVRRREAERALRSAQIGLRIAREIQFRQLPLRAPHLPGYDLGGASVSAELVDGDYFDFLPFRDGTWGVVIADACGHGVGAALLVTQTRACLRTLALTLHQLPQMLATANQLLGEDLPPDRFVTLLLVRLNPESGMLEYVSAGHPTAHVLDDQGRRRDQLTSTGFPLGIEPAATYPLGPRLTLHHGEMLVMVSDGLQESEHEGACFGVDRLLRTAAELRHEPADQIAHRLCEGVLDFCGDRLVSDDLTAVVVKRL